MVHAKICIEELIFFYFQNTFDSDCNEIRMEIQRRKCLRKSNLNESEAPPAFNFNTSVSL